MKKLFLLLLALLMLVGTNIIYAQEEQQKNISVEGRIYMCGSESNEGGVSADIVVKLDGEEVGRRPVNPNDGGYGAVYNLPTPPEGKNYKVYADYKGSLHKMKHKGDKYEYEVGDCNGKDGGSEAGQTSSGFPDFLGCESQAYYSSPSESTDWFSPAGSDGETNLGAGVDYVVSTYNAQLLTQCFCPKDPDKKGTITYYVKAGYSPELDAYGASLSGFTYHNNYQGQGPSWYKNVKWNCHSTGGGNSSRSVQSAPIPKQMICKIPDIYTGHVKMLYQSDNVWRLAQDSNGNPLDVEVRPGGYLVLPSNINSGTWGINAGTDLSGNDGQPTDIINIGANFCEPAQVKKAQPASSNAAPAPSCTGVRNEAFVEQEHSSGYGDVIVNGKNITPAKELGSGNDSKPDLNCGQVVWTRHSSPSVIWIANVDGSNPHKLLRHGEPIRDIMAVWAGSAIVYIDENGNPQLTDKSGTLYDRGYPEGNYDYVQVSPDGNWILLSSTNDGWFDVLSISGPGYGFYRYQIVGLNYTFDPNGSRIVFSNLGKLYELAFLSGEQKEIDVASDAEPDPENSQQVRDLVVTNDQVFSGDIDTQTTGEQLSNPNTSVIQDLGITIYHQGLEPDIWVSPDKHVPIKQDFGYFLATYATKIKQ